LVAGTILPFVLSTRYWSKGANFAERKNGLETVPLKGAGGNGAACGRRGKRIGVKACRRIGVSRQSHRLPYFLLMHTNRPHADTPPRRYVSPGGTLKFNSKSSGENIDGTPIFVKRGISGQLIVEREVDTFEKFAVIKYLYHILRTVMGQFSIPDQNS